MPTSVGPNTFGEENLVFGYDLGDVINSYKGEPTVNYVPGSYEYSLYAYASGPVDTGVVNEKGDLITAKRYTITNAVNTARAAIFPSGLTTGVAYTFSFKWKYNGSTTTSPSVSVSAAKGNPEGNNNSFTSQTGDTVNIGNGWYLTTYTFIFSSVPTSACMLTFGISTGSTAGYVGETFDIYEAQFEIKDHRTQYSNGTRSATQGLIDLTGNSTIDLTNVSFDSNAQIDYDGSNDYASLGNPAALRDLTSGTIETVYYRDASTGTYQMIFTDAGSDLEITYSGNVLQFYIGNSGLSYTHAVTGQWFYVAGTWGPGFKKIYINGVEVASGTNTGIDTGNRDRYIGGRGTSFPFNGKIPMVKVYSRTLTASEVASNYKAIKGRFNI